MTTRCAHNHCYCEIDPASNDDRYCSAYCANAHSSESDAASAASCSCQHSDCGVLASSENSRDRPAPIAMGGGPGAP